MLRALLHGWGTLAQDSTQLILPPTSPSPTLIPLSRNCPVQGRRELSTSFPEKHAPNDWSLQSQKDQSPLPPFVITPKSYCKVTRDWPMGSPELLLCLHCIFPSPSLLPFFSHSPADTFLGGLQVTLLHTNLHFRAVSWGTWSQREKLDLKLISTWSW